MDNWLINGRLADGSPLAIGIADGRIDHLCAAAPDVVEGEVHDLAGRLVVPPFIDGHIHLDKSFLPGDWQPHRACTGAFDVRERVAFEKAALAYARPVRERAMALAELALGNGTLHLRTHADVDVKAGLSNVEALLDLREAMADAITVQIVAFPQSGILSDPGTADLLSAAVDAGADLVGGIDPVGFDGAQDDHLDIVFGIADCKGVPIDIHLHDFGMVGIAQLEDIAQRTLALGMGGRVTVSHAYALGDVPLDVARRTGALLARAGVAIMTNGPGPQPCPPVAALAQEGVLLFSGSDNVRDAWWPYGDADMLERAMMVGYRAGLYTDKELELAFAMVTGNAARALGLRDYGLAEGMPADFVVLNAQSVAEAVVARPKRREVWRGGRRIAVEEKKIDAE